MTSIPSATCMIYSNIFKRYYLRNKRFFWIFYIISEICSKFRAFSKKDEYPTLIISEIIDAERHDYLDV